MVKIAFWDNQLCERGTTIAIYDYAYFNQKILSNESIILYEKNNRNNHSDVIEKFKKEFPTTIGVESFNEVDDILLREKCDLFYIIKYGRNDGKISKVCKNAVHCVFECLTPHGEVYASISPVVSGYNSSIPIVPHMIHLPSIKENFREQLKIPQNALVFGRHGGYDQFDIPFARQAVYDFALQNPNCYFLFVNTRPFCNSLPNIIHIQKIVNLKVKTEFINTCDAMIHVSRLGETFGLSVGEFSTQNKPIISCVCGKLNHKEILGDKGFWYRNQEELTNILNDFKENYLKYRNMEWNCYQDYTPEKVMNIFKNIFI